MSNHGDIFFSDSMIDKVIHEPARLKIMILLSLVESADFIYIMHKTKLSKGNLSSHLKKLDDSGYVEISKDFVEKMPRTLMSLTDNGKKALLEYKKTVSSLLSIVEQ